MDCRRLGSTEIDCSRLGWGAFKIGRDQGTKFPEGYLIPSEEDSMQIIDGMLELGITLLDTAPSYGLSEERLGKAIKGRRDDVILATKVGEQFRNGRSEYDFSSQAAVRSLQGSLQALQTDHVDLLLVHSDGNDRAILEDLEYIETLEAFKQSGMARAIGFSGKTLEGNQAAMAWSDVLMVEYHLEDRSHESLIAKAAEEGVGILIKKALRSGHLPAEQALNFVLNDSPVADSITSIVIGSLSPQRMKSNIELLGA